MKCAKIEYSEYRGGFYMIIKNANIFTMEQEGSFVGDILIEDGKIKEIGTITKEDEVVIDATGLNV